MNATCDTVEDVTMLLMQEKGLLRPLPPACLASTFWGAIFVLVATAILGLRAVIIAGREYTRHVVNIFYMTQPMRP